MNGLGFLTIQLQFYLPLKVDDFKEHTQHLTIDLKPENKAILTNILTYHVVPGKVMAAADVVKMNDIKTVQGGSVKVTVMGDKVMINNANVVKTDIPTSNGVIHVIDTVLMPNTSESFRR